MKNVFLFVIGLICATSLSAQKLVAFTTSATDTLRVNEMTIVKVIKTTAGSNLEYLEKGKDMTIAAIRERSDDTANVASSIAILFAGSAGSIDSITINGVEIMGGTVAFTSNIGTTVGLVEDSINNQTQSPVNYAASVSGTTLPTLTITAPAAFGDTANGYEVIVYTTTITASPDDGEMSGGFTVVRNILTLTDRLFNIEDGAKALNADRVQEVYKKASGAGSVIWYDGARKGTIETTDKPHEIVTSISEL